MLNNPFVLLIVYLLLVLLVLWALSEVLKQMGVSDPVKRIAMLLVGILLLIVAFAMSGVGAMLL